MKRCTPALLSSKPELLRFPNLWKGIPHRREGTKPHFPLVTPAYRVIEPRVLIPVCAGPLAIFKPYFSKRLETTCKKGGAILPYDTPRFQVVYFIVFGELHAKPEVAQGIEGGKGF